MFEEINVHKCYVSQITDAINFMTFKIKGSKFLNGIVWLFVK